MGSVAKDEIEGATAEGKDEKDLQWTKSVGQRPHSVIVYERVDRDNVLWVRFTLPDGAGRDKRTKRPLHLALGESVAYTVRKPLRRSAVKPGEKGIEGKGKVDPLKSILAEEAANKLYYLLKSGVDPSKPAVATERAKKLITLSEGFELAYADSGGMHVAIGRHLDDLKRAAKQSVEHLGVRTLWKDVRSGTVTKLQQRLADTYSTKGVGGPRWSEVVVGQIYAVSKWLCKQGYLEKNDVIEPDDEWREDMRKAWEKRTGKVVKVTRPRHSQEDLIALWSVVDDLSSKIDPRVRLLMIIAAEMRAGQGLNVMRSALTLDATDLAPYGQVQIPGSDNKLGGPVNLSRRDREMVDMMLESGHLSTYEKLYRRGEIRDYPLFPGGKLRGGKCNPYQSRGPMDRRTALEQFHALEEVAGIKVAKGRAWYGIRRRSADVAETLSKDEKAKDALGGWKEGSETRIRVYLEDQAETHRAAAANLREIIRGQQSRGGETAK